MSSGYCLDLVFNSISRLSLWPGEVSGQAQDGLQQHKATLLAARRGAPIPGPQSPKWFLKSE